MRRSELCPIREGSVATVPVTERVVLRSRGYILFAWACAAGSLLLFGSTTAMGPGPDPGPVDYIGTSAFGMIMSLGFLRATRCRVELTEAGVTIFNYMATYRIEWKDLQDASVDYYGLHLRQVDGTVITVGSLGKTNWSTWFRRRTAADDRVDLIQRELRRRSERSA